MYKLFATALLVLIAVVPPATGSTDFDLVKVSDGIFAAVAKPGSAAAGNAGFIAGADGVVVVDTFMTPAACSELIAEIGKATKAPIRFVVNTHYHLDHTGGNQLFAERNVPIIANDHVAEWQTSKNSRFLPPLEELKKRSDAVSKQLAELPADQAEKRAQLERQLRRFEAMQEIHLTNPTMTFGSGVVRLFLGKREVQLFSLPGHTGGDVLAFVPDANVLFTGDMLWAKTLPNLVDATVNDWIPSLDKILAQYPNAKFVSGHGQVASAIEVREFRDYLDDLRTRVKKAIAGGLTLDQAKQQLVLPDAYKSFAFQNFAQPNIEDMYKELTGKK